MKKIIILILFILCTGICLAESGNPTSTMWLYKSDTNEWYKAQADELGNLKISTSSSNDGMLQSKLDNLYILISTGGDTTVARLDTINTEQIKNYVLSSTNTAEILAEMIKSYLLISSGTDSIFDIMNSTITPQQIGMMLWNGSIWVEAPTESLTSPNLKVVVAKGTNSVNIGTMATDTVGAGTFTLGVRAFNYGWNDTDGEFVRLRADRILNIQKTISTIHSEVHDGHMHVSGYVWEALADDTTAVFLIDTSTKNAHMVFNIATSGDAVVKIFEGGVVTSSGTGLSEVNFNRVYSDTQVANLYHSPTGCSGATLLLPIFVGGGAGVGASTTASGGTIRIGTEWVFKKNELYTISVENESGGAAFVSITAESYEEETD